MWVPIDVLFMCTFNGSDRPGTLVDVYGRVGVHFLDTQGSSVATLLDILCSKGNSLLISVGPATILFVVSLLCCARAVALGDPHLVASLLRCLLVSNRSSDLCYLSFPLSRQRRTHSRVSSFHFTSTRQRRRCFCCRRHRLLHSLAAAAISPFLLCFNLSAAASRYCTLPAAVATSFTKSSPSSPASP
ncbi:hypothetical protein BHE74_00039608 [Ensete ventricosum]|nr:hypothetical protein BHE74_00039608 [Ensete ventricosum]